METDKSFESACLDLFSVKLQNIKTDFSSFENKEITTTNRCDMRIIDIKGKTYV